MSSAQRVSGIWQRLRRALFGPPKSLGQRGEAIAARYLQRLGYKVLARGRKLSSGELDLVMLDGKVIVFVEVKTRTAQEVGHPAEAVDADKQRRLTRLAVTFLKRHGLLDRPARFDVVAITWPAASKTPEIEHIIDAFQAHGDWQWHS